MSILTVILVLIIIGFALTMFYTVPVKIHPWWRNLILGIITILVIIWLLQAFGVNTGLHALKLC